MLKEWHGLLDKHQLLLEACELNWVSEEDYIDLGRAGLGQCLLGGLPDWLVAYAARLVFILFLSNCYCLNMSICCFFPPSFVYIGM